jgi:exodeoxyribonuclease VII large subunit
VRRASPIRCHAFSTRLWSSCCGTSLACQGPENSGIGATRIWQVGALCRAVADALDARFNPVVVRGEVSGFSRASSGHCYFSIKDETGQIRCAMFRRAASLLDFVPRDGEIVELRGTSGCL